jgi:pyruvate carboxylase
LIGAIGTNFAILTAIFILELFLKKNGFTSFIVIYNNPELIAHGSRQELKTDLSSYTGHKIEKVNILRMDIGKGSAEVEVFYRE